MKLMNRQVEHPYLDVMALLLVIVVIAGSVLGFTRFRAVEAAKQELAAKQKQRAASVGRFDSLMTQRDEFLAVSLRTDLVLKAVGDKVSTAVGAKQTWDQEYDSNMATFQEQVAAVKAHNDAEDARYHSDPRYRQRDYWTLPSPPAPPAALTLDFSSEIVRLETESAAVKRYVAKIRAAQEKYSNADVNQIYGALRRSAEDMDDAVDRDLEIMRDIVTTGREGQVINAIKADMLKYNAEDANLIVVNSKAVAFAKAQGLEIKDYDLPGGSDADPSDKSRLL